LLKTEGREILARLVESVTWPRLSKSPY